MPRALIRFDTPSSVDGWFAIDDRVMGGASSSRLRRDPAGFAVFEGSVSLEYGGGFASVRSRPMDLSAPGATAFVLEVLGDGKRYKLNLRADDAIDGVNYQVAFDVPAGSWIEVSLPVSDFLPTLRGRVIPGAPALDPGHVRQVGFVIGDRQAGSFALAFRRIWAKKEGPERV